MVNTIVTIYIHYFVNIDHGTFNKTFCSNDFLLRVSYCIIFYVHLDLIHPIIIYKSQNYFVVRLNVSYNQEQMSLTLLEMIK